MVLILAFAGPTRLEAAKARVLGDRPSVYAFASMTVLIPPHLDVTDRSCLERGQGDGKRKNRPMISCMKTYLLPVESRGGAVGQVKHICYRPFRLPVPH